MSGPFGRNVKRRGDRDLFRRLTEAGGVSRGARGAVHETIPAHRLSRSFQLRRALLRGKASLAQSTFSTADVAKSLLASALYSLSLPLLLPFGQHVFMKYLIRDCDHIGRLLAVCGINPVREKYVTE